MTMIRKHYTPAFKTQVVQEALAGERTLAQIAAQHGVHPNLITNEEQEGHTFRTPSPVS
jgi:transposase